MKKIIFSFLFFLCQNILAQKQNVILITIDGVRFQEIFHGVRFPEIAQEERGTELLPKLKRLEKLGKVISFPRMHIANKMAISLPGYRSLLSGEFENICKWNRCPNTFRKTIFDDLFESGISKEKLATFASWKQLALAIESQPGRITRNIEFEPYFEPNLTPREERFLNEVNEKMRTDLPPWRGSRYDKYTFALSKFYLQKHRPRFLYIQLVDSDEYAHERKYKKYLNSIRELDDRIDELLKILNTMGSYGKNTSIVITTDHGRGRGFLWPIHLSAFTSANQVWSYVLPSKKILDNHQLKYQNLRRKSHLDIRPTIEFLLGVPPKSGGANTGRPLIEFK
ncbi:MAG: sulfatase-like hydrolase/transferase [Bacteriovoracaceae bacterium]|nr:sulfatase-like hydrolase/transferase [Bacteriovoracaceae bacterium]